MPCITTRNDNYFLGGGVTGGLGMRGGFGT